MGTETMAMGLVRTGIGLAKKFLAQRTVSFPVRAVYHLADIQDSARRMFRRFENGSRSFELAEFCRKDLHDAIQARNRGLGTLQLDFETEVIPPNFRAVISHLALIGMDRQNFHTEAASTLKNEPQFRRHDRYSRNPSQVIDMKREGSVLKVTIRPEFKSQVRNFLLDLLEKEGERIPLFELEKLYPDFVYSIREEYGAETVRIEVIDRKYPDQTLRKQIFHDEHGLLVRYHTFYIGEAVLDNLSEVFLKDRLPERIALGNGVLSRISNLKPVLDLSTSGKTLIIRVTGEGRYR